ncbi:MAG TPA: hypothetical protein VE078_18395 [Thermoanaerobaculia bacterium]|nr:hypothetical protein [Thermoanaerobaculia bacterium]
MEVKEAVQVAKRHVAELFSEEQLENFGLEEVEYDDQAGVWRVTVGFSRPWNRSPQASTNPSVSELLGIPKGQARDLKVATIDDSAGRVLSVKNRE